jgi:hypothetical protein
MNVEMIKKLNDNDVYTFSKGLSMYTTNNSSDFPVNYYISHTYGKCPVHFYADDLFEKEIYDFLSEKGKLVSFSCNGRLKNITKNFKGFRGGTFFFEYKDIFVKIIRKHQDDSDSHFWDDTAIENHNNKNIYNLSFSGPVGSVFPIKDFEKFIHVSDDSKIHLFVKNQYGDYAFEPLKIKTQKNTDIGLNYGKDFVDVFDTIKDRLSKESSGLYMFHGPSGTGKSTFIKNLTNHIKKDFIYIPTTMLETFTSDPSCLQMLIQKSNSIIVLEDAEKLIMKRHGDSLDTSSVSALLNLSDGILSDILNIAVIITYNCDTKEIDPALKRKGRLKVEYKFDHLSKEDSKLLALSLDYPEKLVEEKIKSSMALADIYNLESEVKFYKEEVREKKIGF